MLEDEYRRLHRGLSGFGDFIIRVALLGTFMGLIAALTIVTVIQRVWHVRNQLSSEPAGPPEL